ncbi:MAG: tryptophan-rich sensory protein [Lachnospiraceae bacterium]|nr:tryptophan-rich sensory protein [Lachnospiraceae bacterium]
MWSKYKPYFISILISLGVGGLSALLVRNQFGMYEQINTPPLSPPSILFPIVWSILYVLMGISAAMIYKTEEANDADRKTALWLYGIQLFFNFCWSPVFFGLEWYLFAFIWLMIMWVIIIVMIIKFYSINKTAAYLQIPYLLWTTFAAYLNFGVYILNR